MSSRPRAHVTGDVGERLFPTLVPEEFVVERQNADYGLDYVVQVAEAFRVTSTRFGCQIKTSARRHARSRGALRVTIETRHLVDWLDTETMPVFLVAIDAADARGYFVDVDHVPSTLPEGWREQRTVTVRVPEANGVNGGPGFRSAIQAAWRRRTSPAAAAARRQREIERLDPRFCAAVNIIDGREHVELRAKEDVECRFSFRSPAGARIFHGDLVTFAPGEAAFAGTPLLEKVGQLGATIRIAAEQAATMSLVATRPLGNSPAVSVPNLPATIIAAPLAVQFKAALMGRLLTWSMELQRNPPSVEARIGLDVGAWGGMRVDALPFLDELLAFTAACVAGSPIRNVLHLPGRDEVLTEALPPRDTIERFAEILMLVSQAREVCRALRVSAALPDELTELHEHQIRRAHALLTTGEYRAPGSAYDFTVTATPICARDLPKRGPVRMVMGGARKPISFLDTEIMVAVESVGMTDAVIVPGRRTGDGHRRFRFSTEKGEFIQRGTPLPTA